MSEWIRVNKVEPCKICQHGDWCCVTSDGTLANCMRIESDRPCNNGGWLHKLDDSLDLPKRLPLKRRKPAAPAKDFSSLAEKYRKSITPSLIEALSKELGISWESLKRQEVGWVESLRELVPDWRGSAYTYPMRSGCDEIIGIQLRTPKGKKFSIPGSKLGLFWPRGVKADSENLLFIPEGSSDPGALLDMKFDAIARPSCSGGAEFIKTLLDRHNRSVVIVADKDSPKTAPDGRKFNPGLDGADRLGKTIKPLCRSVRIIKPCVGKDIRDWYNNGATAEAVLAVVKNTRFL